MKCVYCGGQTLIVTGDRLYPRSPHLADKYFHACLFCAAWVGCHPGTKMALGQVANAELRQARSRAHAAFDPIWKSGETGRTAAYVWLATQLGLPGSRCHIAQFDVAQCQRVVEVCAAREFEE